MKKRGVFELNKIIKYLIYSVLVFYTGWGLVSPILAIFIIQNIVGGNAFVVGMTAALSLIVRSILRVPFGIYADKSQKKAYSFMFWGLLIAALTPLGFIISKYPWHLYLIQVIFGASLALSTAGWAGIFTKYLDKGKGSTEWGIDAVAVGIGPGIAAVVGGIAVTYFSFNLVFILATIFGLIGAVLLLFVKSNILQYRDGSKHKTSFVPHEIRRIKKQVG